MTSTTQKNESAAEKDFGNPVQVNAKDTLQNRTTKNGVNVEQEKEMREKTAHIGFKASHASQGQQVDNDDHPMMSSGSESN